MKGAIIGYAAILAILIAGAAGIIFVTNAPSAEETVTTMEGVLASSSNFNHLLLRTFNQSIEMISQKSAYDLGKYGGFVSGYEVPWNLNYPTMDVLEKNLADEIIKTIPPSYKKASKTVTFDNIDIEIEPDNTLDSKSFYVTGIANISVYDDAARFRTFLSYRINSVVISDYFKLLYAGREILENPSFNSNLNDVNNLKNLLKSDSRFTDLSFEIQASDGFVYVNITKKCFEVDCTAPLGAGEEIENGFPFEERRYDYNKLRLKIEEEQTGSTPTSFDFEIILDHDADSMEAGQSKIIPLFVRATSNDDRTVGLSGAATRTDGTTENSITASFNPNNQLTDYSSEMNISTSSFTPSGDYAITVTGNDGSGTIRTATLDLTVGPSMTFTITVNPYKVKMMSVNGYSNKTSLTVTRTSGTPSNVNLYEIDGLPPGISYASPAPNNMPPNFDSILTLTSDGTAPEGEYEIKVKGKGGGSYAEGIFKLDVDKPFDFDLTFTSIEEETIFRTNSAMAPLLISKKQGNPESINFYFNVINTLTGLSDPSGNNFYITPTIAPSSCTPDPSCYRWLSVKTTKDTPEGKYTILVNASATTVWHQKSFELNVEWGCGDTIIVAPEQCEGVNLGGSNLCTVRFPTINGHIVIGGNLTCIPSGSPNECTLDTSNCIYCSNNKREGTEECDGTDSLSCPGSCKADCTCPTMFNIWKCSIFGSGTTSTVIGAEQSNYFQSPDCSAGWYPASCMSENAFPRQSNDFGKYGEDDTQRIKIEGNHCSIMTMDTNGDNEQSRNVCVLCTNKQPTILWGVTSSKDSGIGGSIVNGWYIRQAGGSTGFAWVNIESQPCPSGKFPIYCLADANESGAGYGDLLDDIYIDSSGRCNATFRNDPIGSEYSFNVNIGIVCTNKDFYQGGGGIVWGAFNAGLDTRSGTTFGWGDNDVAAFPTPSCSSGMPVSAFTKSDRSNPNNYLDDAMQGTYINGQRFNVTAHDASGCFGCDGSEHSRQVGILCALSES